MLFRHGLLPTCLPMYLLHSLLFLSQTKYRQLPLSVRFCDPRQTGVVFRTRPADQVLSARSIPCKFSRMSMKG